MYALDGVKEPQRRIGRVIEPLVLPFGEHVGQQSVADVAGEGADQVARFGTAAGHEGQPFEADHRVAAPIGEPVVAGDHAADLVAGGMCLRGVGYAARRADQELIGRQHEFCRRPASCFGTGLVQQARAPFGLGRSRRNWIG